VSEPKSLYPQLEPLLMSVAKPIQYVGGEPNSVSKAWDEHTVHWVLSYPDAYEIGQPNQGLAILYEVLGGLDWCLAERSFAVWPDLAALLRAQSIPLFTLETHRPVRAFDIWGFSLATELGYTNMLEMIDLAGVPLYAANRCDDDPFIVAGGHCCSNPEPVADFLDIVIMGDGEQAAVALSELVRDWTASGRPGGRDALLAKAAATGQFYVPKFFTPSYRSDGTIESVMPNRAGIPERPVRWVLSDLDAWAYPKKPVVPLAETVHERYSVEVFRGCTRGCRFCQAGFITRPVRERSKQVIEAMAATGLAATGFDEIGLLSLSSADHSQIGEISHEMADCYAGTSVSLSLPSTRVDAFNIDLATELARNGRRTGLTFAPEGGTERMRAVINKNVSEEDLIATVTTAFSQGWRNVKLYFMCGLPTETDEDVIAIAQMAHNVIKAGRSASGRRDIGCTISIGAFVPKPMTSFQWAAQCPPEVSLRRMRALKDTVRADRECGRGITVRYADPEPSLIEGLLARGDRRLSTVIERVWRSGGVFDGWREYFSLERWMEAAASSGIDVGWYTCRERPQDEVLPWDHLDFGLERDWLYNDYQDGIGAYSVPDCRWSGCNLCGVCPAFDVANELAADKEMANG
jgi:radical SAM family uncharacterized protein